MLGTQFIKGAIDWTAYAEAAEWCNENGAVITDQGDYYEVVSTPALTTEEQASSEAATLAANYEEELADLQAAFVTAQMAGDSDLMAEIQEEYAELKAEYMKELEAINNGN